MISIEYIKNDTYKMASFQSESELENFIRENELFENLDCENENEYRPIG